MTTTLALKSFEISGKFYNYVLGYRSFVHFNAVTEQFELTRSRLHLNCFRIYLVSIAFAVINGLDVVFEAWITQTIKISKSCLLIIIFELGITVLCLVYQTVFFLHRKELFYEYFNKLFTYEKKVLRRKHRHVSRESFKSLLQQGKENNK